MKYLIILSLALPVFSGCHSSQKTTTASNMQSDSANTDLKGNLLDGAWVVNYIMHAPKPLTELFPGGGPAITFDGTKGAISGHAGCNNFQGTYTTEGRSISIGENIAVTRKMCPDMSGEQLFMETLKKANTYSVTEQGKTLNLVMDDMAIMRLARKATE